MIEKGIKDGIEKGIGDAIKDAITPGGNDEDTIDLSKAKTEFEPE